MTARQKAFVDNVGSGMSHADAYRKAYNQPKLSAQDAANAAYRRLRFPAVRAALAALKAKSEIKTILNFNERLGILADIAQTGTPNEKVLALKEYNRMSGTTDRPPPPSEPAAAPSVTVNAELKLTGDPANPIHVVTRAPTRQEKLASMRKGREEPLAGRLAGANGNGANGHGAPAS